LKGVKTVREIEVDLTIQRPELQLPEQITSQAPLQILIQNCVALNPKERWNAKQILDYLQHKLKSSDLLSDPFLKAIEDLPKMVNKNK